MQKSVIIPSAITSLRLLILPFLLFFLYKEDLTPFLTLYIISLSTDIIDGYSARKLNAITRMGAYFDSIADFSIIIGVFMIYTLKGLTPYWIPVVIVLSFSVFIITSFKNEKIYDKTGKCFGCFLYIAIILLMTAPFQNIILSYIILLFFIISILSRFRYFLHIN